MTDESRRDRVSAIGRVAILTSMSEQNDDAYVEVATADARALLRERDELAEELAAEWRTIASLTAQRDSMETALNEANRELYLITRCGDVFEPIGDMAQPRPCARKHGHTGAHANIDGARWWARPANVDYRHFSPGYDGEKPDHHGPADTCAMPACRAANLHNAAADAVQDATTNGRDPQ